MLGQCLDMGRSGEWQSGQSPAAGRRAGGYRSIDPGGLFWRYWAEGLMDAVTYRNRELPAPQKRSPPTSIFVRLPDNTFISSFGFPSGFDIRISDLGAAAPRCDLCFFAVVKSIPSSWFPAPGFLL